MVRTATAPRQRVLRAAAPGGVIMAKGLHFDEPAGAGLRRRLRRHLEAAAATATARRPGSTADRIHETRTRLKRARALLRLLRRVEPKAARAANRTLRDAMRPLSALRDADVRLATFDALVAHFGAGGAPGPAARVRRSLLELRHGEPASAAVVARRLRAAATAARTVHRQLTRRPDLTSEDLIAGLGATYAQARQAFRRSAEKGSATAFHEWRKRLKDLRYQLRLFRPAWPRVVKAFEREIADLADQLGDEHDLFLLRIALTRLESKHRPDTKPLLELLAARRAALRREALAAGAKLFATKPRATARLLVRWWLQAADTAKSRAPAGAAPWRFPRR